MTTKHTPGPWINDGDTIKAHDADGFPVSLLLRYQATEADVALAVAAPDLLAALSRVSEFLEANYEPPSHLNAAPDDMPKILLLMREAMKKAGREATPVASAPPNITRVLESRPRPEQPRPSRWRCPECGSTDVQISLPTWYRELGAPPEPGVLVFMETDAEADVLWWHCEACQETEGGLPELNDPANPFTPEE